MKLEKKNIELKRKKKQREASDVNINIKARESRFVLV
jgi:hypothetical protein